MIGVVVSAFFKILKASLDPSLKSNGTSLCNKLERGLTILLKSWINLLQNPACPRNIEPFSHKRCKVTVTSRQDFTDFK